MAVVTQTKARKILRHGEVRGRPLTPGQRGFFGTRIGESPVKPPRREAFKRLRRRRGTEVGLHA